MQEQAPEIRRTDLRPILAVQASAAVVIAALGIDVVTVKRWSKSSEQLQGARGSWLPFMARRQVVRGTRGALATPVAAQTTSPSETNALCGKLCHIGCHHSDGN